MLDTLLDFLAFRVLISEQVLILFYYLGALGMPLAAWFLAGYLMRRFDLAQEAYDAGKYLFATVLPKRRRVLAIALFVAAFLFMELLWRMMFEYLIAFMQIRNALVG